MPDHRQRGAKIASCCACGEPVWSNMPSVIVSGNPLKIAHEKCVQAPR